MASNQALSYFTGHGYVVFSSVHRQTTFCQGFHHYVNELKHAYMFNCLVAQCLSMSINAAMQFSEETTVRCVAPGLINFATVF